MYEVVAMASSWLPKVRVAGKSVLQSVPKQQNIKLRIRTACNVAPVFLDTTKTVQKTIGLIREAAHNRADLVVFPETYIPAYPLWVRYRQREQLRTAY